MGTVNSWGVRSAASEATKLANEAARRVRLQSSLYETMLAYQLARDTMFRRLRYAIADGMPIGQIEQVAVQARVDPAELYLEELIG